MNDELAIKVLSRFMPNQIKTVAQINEYLFSYELVIPPELLREKLKQANWERIDRALYKKL